MERKGSTGAPKQERPRQRESAARRHRVNAGQEREQHSRRDPRSHRQHREEPRLRKRTIASLAPDVTFLSRIRELTEERGADTVLECSGKGLAYAAGLGSLRIGGTFVAIGEGAKFDLPSKNFFIPGVSDR